MSVKFISGPEYQTVGSRGVRERRSPFQTDLFPRESLHALFAAIDAVDRNDSGHFGMWGRRGEFFGRSSESGRTAAPADGDAHAGPGRARCA
jgi:hypothetical protein